MKVFFEEGITRVPIKAWVDGVELEAAAEQQLRNVAGMPFVWPHLAVMPDCHWGHGATVGSVIPTEKAIIPAAVGVDIGCGVIARRLDLTASQLPDNLASLRSAIEKAVPHGRTDQGGRNDRGAWGDPPQFVRDAWAPLDDWYKRLTSLYASLGKGTTIGHLGTLGSGNHFIEVCLDEQQRVWVMLHSGSRGIGNRIGQHFIALAKKDMERWHINLPDKDLAYLPEGSDHFTAYVNAVKFGQDFAKINREVMMTATLAAIGSELGRDVSGDVEAINCFAAETKVLTKNGVKYIRDLVEGIHEVLTTGGKWVFAPIRSFGYQQLMKITLSRSGVKKIIYATPNHGWIIAKVQRKSIRLTTTEHLIRGDRLASCFPKQIDNLSVDTISAARGFVFGDGSKSSKNRARAIFCGAKDQSLLPLFLENNLGRPPRTYSKFIIINGLPQEWKTAYPSLEAESSLLYGWLAGYFAADGAVDITGRPTLTSSVKANLEFVRELCTRLCIGTFGIRKTMRKGFGSEKTPLYILGFMRKDLDSKFFLIPSHRERFVATIDTIAERRAWTVIAVEPTQRNEEVFCATVEDTHTFTLEDNILTRNCHHNYIANERHFGRKLWITRKGAVSAQEGELGIIPGSMGAKSFIVRGKGNRDSLCSCSHGAGRRMSRTEAKKRFTVEDHTKATEGVECRKDAGVIDETPGSYKDIDKVMEAQADLVDIVHTIKQVLCVKG